MDSGYTSAAPVFLSRDEVRAVLLALHGAPRLELSMTHLSSEYSDYEIGTVSDALGPGGAQVLLLLRSSEHSVGLTNGVT